MSSDKDKEDPDISRLFAQKADRRFQRDFGRFMQPHNVGNGDERQQQRRQSQHVSVGNSKSDQLTVKLIEANETAELLRRQLDARNEEIERLKRAEAAKNDRLMEAQKESAKWKTEAERSSRRLSSVGMHGDGGGWRELNTKNNDKLLLDDYRAALSKYCTWMQFAGRQLQTMKTLLEERGGWTEANRYKLYFSYRDVVPSKIKDENVAELAAGSILSYVYAIEDVENISATLAHPKFHNVTTQTDANEEHSSMLEVKPVLSTASHSQHSQLHTSFLLGSQGGGEPGMAAHELRLLDCERDIERLEMECANQRERLIILSARAKHVELLEEQKTDLVIQANILKQQNERLILDHEQLKSVFGGGSISRNNLEELVRNATQLREKNQELDSKVRQLELESQQRETLPVMESRRIAQLFKRKYEKELNELRSRLHQYEPLHASDTTRILRFASGNPLDEACDEMMIRDVAAAATSQSASSMAPNPLKRRKLSDDDGAAKKKANLNGKEFTDKDDLAEEEEYLESGQLHELRVQNCALKSQLEQNEKNSSELLRDYRETVSLLSGYDVHLGEEGFFEVQNVNSKDCTFLFKKHNNVQPPTIDLLDNECAQRWKDIIENYLIRYRSVPAFLSAVTISLVESPEDCVSSSQQSNSETDPIQRHECPIL